MNLVFHKCTKHVGMDCYFVREHVESKDIDPKRISTSVQIAEVFTKALGADHFYFLISKLGVRDPPIPSRGGVMDILCILVYIYLDYLPFLFCLFWDRLKSS